jgi:hypothetical protein
MRRPLDRFDYLVLAMLLSLACATAYMYVWAIDVPHAPARMDIQNSILSGKAGAPLRYRVLVPFLVKPLVDTIEPYAGSPEGFIWAYAVFNALAVFASLVAMYYYLREWFPRSGSLIGALFAGGMMQVTYHYQFYQPWSLLEPAFFALGLWLIHREKYGWLLLTIFVATLNRETAAFLALAYLFVSIGRWTEARRRGETPALGRLALAAAGPFVVWAVAYFGLVLLRGQAPPLESVAFVFHRNVAGPYVGDSVFNNLLFLGLFWIFVVRGVRRAPKFVLWTAWIVPVYFATVIAFTNWYETRPLMSLYPILIPLGLSFAGGFDPSLEPEAREEPGRVPAADGSARAASEDAD